MGRLGMPLGLRPVRVSEDPEMTMKPIAAAVAGALISGVAMYTVGAKTATVDAFTSSPALVQAVDGEYLPAVQPAGVVRTQLVSSQPVSSQSVSPKPAVRASSPARRSVSRPASSVQRDAPVVRAEAPEGRSWKKTALIIGGSAASGAGVGAIVDGKKGAVIGAAIGGGAASIYEATKR